MVVIVPAATTTTALALDIYVDVPIDIDVIDAGIADIVGAYIGLAVIDPRSVE